MKTIYEVYANRSIENDYQEESIGFFFSGKDAVKAAISGKHEIREIEVFETVEEFRQLRTDEIRKETLTKLTPEEQKVLGFPDSSISSNDDERFR